MSSREEKWLSLERKGLLLRKIGFPLREKHLPLERKCFSMVKRLSFSSKSLFVYTYISIKILYCTFFILNSERIACFFHLVLIPSIFVYADIVSQYSFCFVLLGRGYQAEIIDITFCYFLRSDVTSFRFFSIAACIHEYVPLYH